MANEGSSPKGASQTSDSRIAAIFGADASRGWPGLTIGGMGGSGAAEETAFGDSAAALSRQGSLQPQWMQQRAGAGGGAGGGEGAGRRASVDSRPPGGDRWPGSEDAGEQERDAGRGRWEGREDGGAGGRPSRWRTDDRETWAPPKDRWTSGQEGRRWVDPPGQARQPAQRADREHWGGSEVSGLSRSYGDRWDTEGDRWTAGDRDAYVPKHDYVPKNPRWNDEERGDRWRASGGTQRTEVQPPRGFTNQRNRGSVPYRSERDGGEGASAPPHMRAQSQAKVAVGKYSKKQLLDIYDTMLQKLGAANLPMPDDSEKDYPGLLKSEYDQPHVIKPRQSGRFADDDGQESMDHHVGSLGRDGSKDGGRDDSLLSLCMKSGSGAGISKEHLEADQWMYQDPDGNLQGPFGKEDLLNWWEEGFFPEDLPVRSALAGNSDFVPIKQLLKMWNPPPPPGFGVMRQSSLQSRTSASAAEASGQSSSQHLGQTPSQDTNLHSGIVGDFCATSSAPSPAPSPDVRIPRQATQQAVGSLDSRGSWQVPDLGPAERLTHRASLEGHPFERVEQSLAMLTLQQGMGQAGPAQRPQGLPLVGRGCEPPMPAYNPLLGLQQQAGLPFGTPPRQGGHSLGAMGTPPLAPFPPHPVPMPHQFDNLHGLPRPADHHRLGLPPEPSAQDIFNVDLGLEQQAGRVAFNMQHLGGHPMGGFPPQNPNPIVRPDVLSLQSHALLQGVRNPGEGHGASAGPQQQGGNYYSSPFHLPPTSPQPHWSLTGGGVGPGSASGAVTGMGASPAASILNATQQALESRASANKMTSQSLAVMTGIPPVMGSHDVGRRSMDGGGSVGLLPPGPLLSQGIGNALQLGITPQKSGVDKGQAKADDGVWSQLLQPDLRAAAKPVGPPSSPARKRSPAPATEQLPASAAASTPAVNLPTSDAVTTAVAPVPSTAAPPSGGNAVRPAEDSKKTVAGAAWGARANSSAPSLRAIQEQEKRHVAQAAVQEPEPVPSQQAGPSVAGRAAASSPVGWSGNQGRSKPQASLRDIMEAGDGDDSLFWDYSPATQATPPKAWASSHPGIGGQQPRSQAPRLTNVAPIRPAAEPVSAPPIPTSTPNTSRTTPRSARSSAAKQPAVAAQPRQPSGQAQQPRGPVAKPPAAKPPTVEAQGCKSAAPQPGVVGEGGLFGGQFKISQSFRDWCQRQMKELTGNDDMALVEFLLSLKGRMEVVEYIQEYFKGAPKERVAEFTREFMVRKENDGTTIRREEHDGHRRMQNVRGQPQGSGAPMVGFGNDSDLQTQTASEAQVVAEGQQGGQAPGWEKVKGNKGNKAKAKVKKGQPKGHQVPAELLGFRSNFDVLARGVDK
ncbi:unnamed protein product [Ostreobium quekettii]|uniref:GYF domain-containing protein n=1 Tax=Ostreobium quekettii TaxID=121088 RepID=A0A8S1J3A7_9CHLO|nr:unnamed protein product [Ostreobium quekettii]